MRVFFYCWLERWVSFASRALVSPTKKADPVMRVRGFWEQEVRAWAAFSWRVIGSWGLLERVAWRSVGGMLRGELMGQKWISETASAKVCNMGVMSLDSAAPKMRAGLVWG